METLVYWLPAVFLGIIGAAVGSFLNVVIYRSLDEKPLKKKESWVSGRSRCDNCGKTIAWYDNIPLLSFIILRGKCRNCHKPIGATHLVLEVLTAALFVWWYIWGSLLFFNLGGVPFQFIQPFFWLVVGVLLLFIVMSDIWYFIIPDTAVALLIIVTIGYRAALVAAGIMQPQDLAASLAASIVAMMAFGGLWLLTKGRGLGFGDVKLIFPLSLLVGWPVVVVMVFGAFVLGSVVGLILLATNQRKWRQPIPFGPFLIASTCLCLIWGETLLNWYLGFLL